MGAFIICKQVYQSLAMFDPQTCNEIVNKFLESDLTKVANKSGWLVGIIKRFKNDGYACSAANAQVCCGMQPAV